MSVKMERGHEWAILSSPRATMSTMANPEKGQSGKMDSGQTMLGGWGPGGLA